MITVGAKILEQHVQAFGFRDKHRGPQHVAHAELLLAGVEAQQVFGQQDADDMIAVAFKHRKARVVGLDDQRHEFVRCLGDIDHVHLRARDHDVAGLHFRHL